MGERTQITYKPLYACGAPVKVLGNLLGFCERGEGHRGPHTHTMSDCRVWWQGKGDPPMTDRIPKEADDE